MIIPSSSHDGWSSGGKGIASRARAFARSSSVNVANTIRVSQLRKLTRRGDAAIPRGAVGRRRPRRDEREATARHVAVHVDRSARDLELVAAVHGAGIGGEDLATGR